MDEPTAFPAAVRLGVPGLPNLTDSLMVGGVYMLIAETASARFPILSTSLSSGLNCGVHCTVILPQNPEVFIQRIESYGNLNVTQAIGAHQMKMFLMQDEFSKKMFRYGADAFVQELAHFEIPDNSYLLFDQADDLLSFHDVVLALDQVEILRKWASEHQITMMLVLTRTTEAHTSTINALMDDLTGIVRLGASRSGLELSFDYWQSPEGTIAGRNFLLKTLDSGLYQASSNTESSEGSTNEARFDRADIPEGDDAQFFFMNPDLGSLAKQMQGKWQRVDTLVGMMHATRNLRSATCILSFQRDTNLRQLAEAIHTLRLSMGRYARIVVQEKEASLRYQNEALLLKLGLNLVVNRDVPLGRLPLLLESLKGQIFNRDVDINFEAALASVLPTRLRGYLLPQRFTREADVVLERAETLNIPCALVIGRPAPGIAMIDIMTNNSISRPGDLITADSDNCYIFLNACPQAVLLPAIERIMGMPVDTVFPNVRFVIQRAEIQSELAALLRLSEHENLPDYSSVAGLPEETISIKESPSPSALIVATPSKLEIIKVPDIKPPDIKAQEFSKLISNLGVKTTTPPIKQPEIKSPMKQTPKLVNLPKMSDARNELNADSSIFQYDDTANVNPISQKAVPRATRAIKSNQ
jgi:cellulose biosynthesis protein BcsE